MISPRREYSLVITLNKRKFTRVVIDSHYQEKHRDMTDALILGLVSQMDGMESEAVAEDEDGFSYLAHELSQQGKRYRIVLTYCHESFLGVVNAFRIKEKNHGTVAKKKRN